MRIAYLSYDGALDPLGSSQVVPYLEGLADRGFHFDLITFEKADRLKNVGRVQSMASRLARAQIEWHPLRYHKTPRLPATFFDLIRGALRLKALHRNRPFDLFHCRGDVPAALFRMARIRGPLLLDMRGFYADERVDAGSWRAGSFIDRLVRSAEQANQKRASRIIVLTRRAQGVLRERGVDLSIDVIPTCVDTNQFSPPEPSPAIEFDLVYFGSLGGWYMTGEMIDFVSEIRQANPTLRVLFLANNVAPAASARLLQAGVSLRSAAPEEVPGWLSKCRAAFFFIGATPSKRASCPTKLAEALAMGLPILTNSGVGDVDEILLKDRLGVVVGDFSPASYRRAWQELNSLLSETSIRARCRSVAEKDLSLTGAVNLYAHAYGQILPTTFTN